MKKDGPFVPRGTGIITWIATLMAGREIHIKTSLKFSLFHRADGCDKYIGPITACGPTSH